MSDYSETVSKTRESRDSSFQAAEANSVASTPERIVDACSNAIQHLTKAMIVGACCVGGVYLFRTISEIAGGVNRRRDERALRADARYYLMKGRESATDVDTVTISNPAG